MSKRTNVLRRTPEGVEYDDEFDSDDCLSDEGDLLQKEGNNNGASNTVSDDHHKMKNVQEREYQVPSANNLYSTIKITKKNSVICM